jgi:hypothetical protein
MSFQTSQDDISFGPSGEKILSSSIKGQIFEFQNTVYILYTELINNQYSIIVYNTHTEQKSILYTSSEPSVIRTLQLDSVNRKIWFGGYLDSPMRGFFASTTISPTQTFASCNLTLCENTKSVETITVINGDTMIYAAISSLQECWVMTNSTTNIYKINTNLIGISVKDVYIRNKVYYIFIDGISPSTNRNEIELYKISSLDILTALFY